MSKIQTKTQDQLVFILICATAISALNQSQNPAVSFSA